MASKWNKTKWPGIYYEIKRDGSKSWIATWKEPIVDPANPFGEKRRTVERRSATSDEARIVKHTGELNAREMRETQFDPVRIFTERVTVSQWAATVESTRRRRSDSSTKRDTALLHNHVFPTLGNLTVSQINRRQHVEPWVTDLSAHLAPSTVRRIVQLLSRAMEAAMDEGLILRNPTRGVELPPEKHKEADHLTVDEIHAVAAAIDARFRAMVYLGGFAGLRVGEAAALTQSRLDLDGAALRIDYTLTRDGDLKEPKTRSSRRTVALSPFLVEELTFHTASFPVGETDLVFTMPDGGAIHMSNWRRRFWQPACETALGRRSRFHALRHGHTVQLQAARVDPKLSSPGY